MPETNGTNRHAASYWDIWYETYREVRKDTEAELLDEVGSEPTPHCD